MEIRTLKKTDDLHAVSRIYEKSWKFAYKGIVPQDYLDGIPAGRWAFTLGQADCDTLILAKDGVLFGTSSVCPSLWPDWPNFGEIVSLYLMPEYMGKGCGAPLLNAAVRALERMGFRDVLLWVLEENHRARRFYKKNGFRPSGASMEDTIGGKPLRELLYCRRIGE